MDYCLMQYGSLSIISKIVRDAIRHIKACHEARKLRLSSQKYVMS